jgi:hypothetical protein
MKRLLLLIIPVFLIGCTNNDGTSQAENTAGSTMAPRPRVGPNDLIGGWVLVDQRGYGRNHPRDVEQLLTFNENGQMTNLQSTGGQSLAMVLTYRVEGDEILASVVSAELDGEPLELGEATPQQTYRWQIEGGRLILEGSEPGTHDVYRRDE